MQSSSYTIGSLVIAALLAGTCGVSSAAIVETEPNDDLANADVIARGAVVPFADVGVMSLQQKPGLGDVDVFGINLFTDEVLSVITTPLESFPTDPDTVLGLFNEDGILVEMSDDQDDSDSRGSALDYLVPNDGTYYIAVSGFGDEGELGDSFGDGNFNGDHNEIGSYALTLSVILIPEPTTGLALTGLGGLLLRRRR